MRATVAYRCLLLLYPAKFRQQFSEEMISVFEQRAGEPFASRKFASFAFLLREFSSIVKGAYVMWLSKVLPIDRKGSRADSATTAAPVLTATEVATQREGAIKKMVTAIAEHDFVGARRYSEEEARLKARLRELENGNVATHHGLA
jgi:hypothetical protein